MSASVCFSHHLIYEYEEEWWGEVKRKSTDKAVASTELHPSFLVPKWNTVLVMFVEAELAARIFKQNHC